MRIGRTFFIADDDDDDIFFFKEALEEVDKDNKLITASDGIEAMDMLKKNNTIPDFIFLDLNMPKKSGKECLVEIRQQQKFRNTPVIIYSTSSLSGDKRETLDMGATYFITKFIDFSDLCNVIRNLLSDSLGKNVSLSAR